MKQIIFTLFILGSLVSSLMAQVSFKYQGVARNAQNAPLVNQNIALRLSILNAANTPVYSETHATKTSDLGIFNVNVCGGANPSGSCATIDWSAAGYQLKVELDPTGGSTFVNMGNSPILQVPIASYATKAGSVVGDNDGNPQNEIQSLSFNKATNELSISQGNKVDLTLPKDDVDTTNEIQKISLDTTNNEVILSKGGGSFILPSSGASLWKKVGNDLVYQHTANTGITFNQGKFAINFSPTTIKSYLSSTIGWSEEYSAKPTNTGIPQKTVTYGSEIIEYPVTLTRHFTRFNTDTMWKATTFNYVFQPGSSPGYVTQTDAYSQAANGTTPVRVLSARQEGSGGLGNFHAYIGNRLGATAGVIGINISGNTVITPFVGIYNASNNVFGLFFNASGQATFSAQVKNFVEDHPKDASKQIWYACVEGPEAAAFNRGTGQLVNGEGEVKFPEHFELTINPNTLTIQITPLSAESEGIAVIEKTATGFKVKELRKGTGTYQFDWEAKGVRKGYENYEPVRDRMKVQDVSKEVIDVNNPLPYQVINKK